MTKTKDEILMVALGVKQFSSLEKWQREQLYYAMDEWATQHKTAQLQQHGVVRPAVESGSEGEPLATEAGAQGGRDGCKCDIDYGFDKNLNCRKCGKLYEY